MNTAVARDRLLCAEYGEAAILARRARLAEPQVADLTRWVQTVRDRLDQCHAATVCDFDPDGGGVNARVMYLAQDPSSTASYTGFISPDNNDATARATTEACAIAELGARERVHWNVYPWWVAAPCPNLVAKADELAATMLIELLELLPHLASVVLIGGKAERSWERLKNRQVRSVRPHIQEWSGPHPSHGWWAKPYKPGLDGRLGREVVVDALREARAHAYPPDGPEAS